MSEILEKTFSTLPRLLVGGLAPVDKDRGGSRGFRNFVKLVGNVKSKGEEEVFISKELSLQKQKLSQPNLTNAQRRENLMRLLYCHMLGYDVSFAYIHAVKQAQQGTVLEKKVGYLTCALFFDNSHEFVMLLINTIQKDLRSTNVLEICMALTAACQLVNTEMVPALLPLVQDRLTHPKEVVRRRAVMCIHRFHQIAPGNIQQPLIYKALCDKHPSVMWAALYVYQDLVKDNPSEHSGLVPGLVSILSQIIGRKLLPDYEFHTVPAPWLTIQVLKLMAKLGANNQSASEKMYPILKEVLQCTEPSHKVGLAVIYGCLETIAAIYPHNGLLELSAKCVSRFLSASNLNLKYIGVKILTSLVAINPRYALEHQSTVLDCLEHSDASIRTKTLELLYAMAQPGNVAVICDRLMQHFQSSDDEHHKTLLLHKVIDLIHRFASDLQWYISTMNKVLMTANKLTPHDAAANAINTIQYGLSGQSKKELPSADDQVWLLKEYCPLIKQENLPSAIVQIGAWVLGEYCQVGREPSPAQVIEALQIAFTSSSDVATWNYIISALKKQALHISKPEETLQLMKAALKPDTPREIVQSLSELEGVCSVGSSLQVQLSPQTRIPHNQLDLMLSFLDEFVSEALENGAKPYSPAAAQAVLTGQRIDQIPFSALQFTPYETPQPPASMYHGSGVSPYGPGSSGSPSDAKGAQNKDSVGLNLTGVKSVWGKEGIIKEEKQPAILSDAETNSPEQAEEASIVTEEPHEEQTERQKFASALFGPSLSHGPSEDKFNPLSPSPASHNSSSKLLPKGTPPALHLSNTPSARLIHEGELSPDSIDSPVLMSSSVPGPWSQPAPPPPTQSQSMYADFNASPKKESSHSSSNVNELLVDSYEQISPSQVLLQGTLPERKRTTSEEARMSDSDSFCDSLTSDLQDGLRLDPDPAAEVSPCLKADGGSVNSLYNDSCLDIRFRKKLSCHGGLEILLTLENVSGEEIEQLQGACLKLEAPNGVLAEFVDQKSFASLSGLVKENSLLELPVFITCTVPQSEFCVHLLLESSSTKASLLLNLAITDFLRPLTMNMEQFALDWAASPSAEKIIQIKASDLSSDGDVMTAGSIMTTLGTQLNFSTVASEGNECLLASEWTPSPDARLLLHLHHHGDSLLIDLVFRAPELLNTVLEALSQLVLNKYS